MKVKILLPTLLCTTKLIRVDCRYYKTKKKFLSRRFQSIRRRVDSGPVGQHGVERREEITKTHSKNIEISSQPRRGPRRGRIRGEGARADRCGSGLRSAQAPRNYQRTGRAATSQRPARTGTPRNGSATGTGTETTPRTVAEPTANRSRKTSSHTPVFPALPNVAYAANSHGPRQNADRPHTLTPEHDPSGFELYPHQHTVHNPPNDPISTHQPRVTKWRFTVESDDALANSHGHSAARVESSGDARGGSGPGFEPWAADESGAGPYGAEQAAAGAADLNPQLGGQRYVGERGEYSTDAVEAEYYQVSVFLFHLTVVFLS